MAMWSYKETRSKDFFPSIISPDLISEGAFIFLGICQPLNNIDYDEAIKAMDRLLPLYLYTESSGTIEQPSFSKEAWKFSFKSGCKQKLSSTKASLASKKLDIRLRHNDIQYSLYKQLSEKYGKDDVGTEIASGKGTSVDLIVRHPKELWFYEIKTAHTAKSCIRQAIGQLLEYSYWPKNKEATRLIIVGEPELDDNGAEYLEALRVRFKLPLEYESIKMV